MANGIFFLLKALVEIFHSKRTAKCLRYVVAVGWRYCSIDLGLAFFRSGRRCECFIGLLRDAARTTYRQCQHHRLHNTTTTESAVSKATLAECVSFHAGERQCQMLLVVRPLIHRPFLTVGSPGRNRRPPEHPGAVGRDRAPHARRPGGGRSRGTPRTDE